MEADGRAWKPDPTNVRLYYLILVIMNDRGRAARQRTRNARPYNIIRDESEYQRIWQFPARR